MIRLAVLLVALNGPDKQIIWVNPEEVVSVRAPREQHQAHFSPNINCLLQTVDGKAIAVADECDAVRVQLGKGLDAK